MFYGKKYFQFNKNINLKNMKLLDINHNDVHLHKKGIKNRNDVTYARDNSTVPGYLVHCRLHRSELGSGERPFLLVQIQCMCTQCLQAVRPGISEHKLETAKQRVH